MISSKERSVLVRRNRRAQVRWDRLYPRLSRGFPDPAFCTLILPPALPPLIHGKSRMRKRACTDLWGGRSAMVGSTATVTPGGRLAPLLPDPR